MSSSFRTDRPFVSLTCEIAGVPPGPEVSATAESAFGDRLATAVRYAGWLAGPGATRGIMGPREAERLWERHLLNCALVADLVPSAAHVIDIGSGGGLPGIVLALARPDLRVTLIDSKVRRTTFLTEVVEDLGLEERVDVVRARAEEMRREADVVTSRAVADLATVGAWSAGLVRPGGHLLAVRGAAADDEVAGETRALATVGWQDVDLVERTYEGVTTCRVVRAIRR